jgi:hypothetical protein
MKTFKQFLDEGTKLRNPEGRFHQKRKDNLQKSVEKPTEKSTAEKPKKEIKVEPTRLLNKPKKDNLTNKTDSAGERAKELAHKSVELGKKSFHAGMERPKMLAKGISTVTKPVAKLGWNILKKTFKKQQIVPYRPK